MTEISRAALFGKLNPWFRAIGINVPDYVYMDYTLIVALIMGVLVWFVRDSAPRVTVTVIRRAAATPPRVVLWTSSLRPILRSGRSRTTT